MESKIVLRECRALWRSSSISWSRILCLMSTEFGDAIAARRSRRTWPGTEHVVDRISAKRSSRCRARSRSSADETWRAIANSCASRARTTFTIFSLSLQHLIDIPLSLFDETRERLVVHPRRFLEERFFFDF